MLTKKIRKFISYYIRLRASKDVSDVSYLLLLQCVNYVLPLVVLPYLMITLGVEKYGYLGLSLAFVQYFILFVDFGFGLSATKRIAIAYGHDKQSLNKIFHATLYAKLMLFIVASLFFCIIGYYVPQFKAYRMTMLCTYPMMIGSLFTFSWFYQGIGKIKLLSLINTFSKILILPLTFFFVKTSNDYNIAALIQSSVFVLGGGISVVFLIRMNILTYSKFNFCDMKTEIKESFPLFLSLVSTSMYTQLFTVILGILSTPNAVGRYSAAERIMRALCSVLYTPISQTFYPKIASMSIENRAKAQLVLKRLLHIVTYIMSCVLLVLFFFSDSISHLLGKGYEDISVLLKIISFAPLAIGLGGILGQMGLIAMGNTRTKHNFQTVYFIIAPISILLVTVLAPFLEEIGAAIALLLTEYLVFVMILYYTKKNQLLKKNNQTDEFFTT